MRHVFALKLAPCLVVLLWCARAPADDLRQLMDDAASQQKKTCLPAIDEIARLGAAAKPAAPVLTEALRHADPEVRWHAARTLGSIGPDAQSAVPALVQALGDSQPKVRAYAAFALGQIQDRSPEVVDRLIQSVFDKSPLVRRACLRALRKINPPEEKTLPIVLKILDEEDPAIVMPALSTLAEEGAEVVPRLCNVLKHERACYWACLVLAEIGPEAKLAVPHLRSVLRHKDPEVRLQALVTLGQIGPASKPLVPDIVAALEHDDFDGVRYAAAFALGKIGPTEEAVRALEAAAASKDPFLQMISAWALARTHPQDKAMVDRAVRLIVEAFKSDDVHLRRAAAKVAVDFDVPAELAVPALVNALKDKDPTVVANAIEALAELGPKALRQIGQSLKHKELRHYGLRLIHRMGRDAASAVPALVEILGQEPQNEEDLQFLREAQFALAAIGPAARQAVPALVQSLASDDEQVRASASYALGKIGPQARAAVPALRQNLKSRSPVVRLASIRALLEIQPRERRLAIVAAPLLIKALQNERELVRAEAASALGRLGELGKPAIPHLKQLLNDESQVVRDAAAEALKKLEG